MPEFPRHRPAHIPRFFRVRLTAACRKNPRHPGSVAGFQASDGDHRVNLRGAEPDRAPGLKRLRPGVHRAKRKPGHRRDSDSRAAQPFGRPGNPRTVHADAEKPELPRLVAEPRNIRLRGVRLQKRVVNESSDIHVGKAGPNFHPCQPFAKCYLRWSNKRRVRLGVRTQPSQGWCTGSNPVRAANFKMAFAPSK